MLVYWLDLVVGYDADDGLINAFVIFSYELWDETKKDKLETLI